MFSIFLKSGLLVLQCIHWFVLYCKLEFHYIHESISRLYCTLSNWKKQFSCLLWYFRPCWVSQCIPSFKKSTKLLNFCYFADWLSLFFQCNDGLCSLHQQLRVPGKGKVTKCKFKTADFFLIMSLRHEWKEAALTWPQKPLSCKLCN